MFLGIYAVIGLSRSLTLAGLCSAFGVSIILLPPRVTTSAAIIIMALAALTANRVREHRAKMTDLANLQDRLVILNESFADTVSESNTDLTEQVKTYLDPAVRNIHDLLDRPGDASADMISQVLVTTVAEVVRPLTEDLGRTPEENPPPEVPTRRPEAAFRVRDTRVDVARAVRPVIMLAFVLFTLVYRPLRMPSASINATFVITILALVLLLVAARRFRPRRLAVLTLPVAIATLVGLFAASAFAPGLILQLITPISVAEAFPFRGASLAFWVLLGLGVSLPSLVEQFAEQSETAAADVNLKLELVRARFQRQLWINRRNLTWVLHGPIQSALVSSAMALSQGDDDPAVRERVRVNLAAALAQLEGTRMAHPDLRLALGDIASVWSASCAVSWSIDPYAGLVFDDDRDTIRCVAEIVREGVSNAVRHGAAKHVDVVIDVPGGQLTGALRVQIIDDGNGLSASASPGLGSAMLDELTHSWTRRSEGLRTTLSASVPTRVLAG